MILALALQTPVLPVTFNGGFHDMAGRTISSPGIILENGAILENAVVNCTDRNKDAITIINGGQVLNCQIGNPLFSFPAGYSLPYSSHIGVNVLSGVGIVRNSLITAYSYIGLLFGPGSNDGVFSGLHVSSNIRMGGNLPFCAVFCSSGVRGSDSHMWGDEKEMCALDGTENTLTNCEIENGLPDTLVVCGADNIVTSTVRLYDIDPASARSQQYKPIGLLVGQQPYLGLNNTGGWCRNCVLSPTIGIAPISDSDLGKAFVGGNVLTAFSTITNTVSPTIKAVYSVVTTTTKALANRHPLERWNRVTSLMERFLVPTKGML